MVTRSLLEGTILGKKKACWRKPYSEALQKIHTFMISKIIQKSLKAISNKGCVCNFPLKIMFLMCVYPYMYKYIYVCVYLCMHMRQIDMHICVQISHENECP